MKQVPLGVKRRKGQRATNGGCKGTGNNVAESQEKVERIGKTWNQGGSTKNEQRESIGNKSFQMLKRRRTKSSRGMIPSHEAHPPTSKIVCAETAYVSTSKH